MAASPGSLLGLIAGQHDLDTRAQTYTNFNARSSVTIVQMDATGDLGGNDAFYVFPGLDFDFLVPAIPRFDYTMSFLSAQPNGLSLISSNQVQVAPGETAGFIAPIKPRTVNTHGAPPTINRAQVTFAGNGGPIGPRLEITGKDFTFENPYRDGGDLGKNLEDLFVTIEVGGRDFVKENGELEILGGRDIIIDGEDMSLSGDKLTVPIPAGVMIGGTTITVNRPMNLPQDGFFRRQVISTP